MDSKRAFKAHGKSDSQSRRRKEAIRRQQEARDQRQEQVSRCPVPLVPLPLMPGQVRRLAKAAEQDGAAAEDGFEMDVGGNATASKAAKEEARNRAREQEQSFWKVLQCCVCAGNSSAYVQGQFMNPEWLIDIPEDLSTAW